MAICPTVLCIGDVEAASSRSSEDPGNMVYGCPQRGRVVSSPFNVETGRTVVVLHIHHEESAITGPCGRSRRPGVRLSRYLEFHRWVAYLFYVRSSQDRSGRDYPGLSRASSAQRIQNPTSDNYTYAKHHLAQEDLSTPACPATPALSSGLLPSQTRTSKNAAHV